MNCPFCTPDILYATYTESDNFRAVYNIAPILPGHSLILPKKHICSFLDILDEQMAEMMLFSKKVIKVLTKAFDTSSFDWTIQEGIPAGQTIEHLHLHIIPRHEGDMPHPGDWYPALLKSKQEIIDSTDRPKLSSEELNSIVSHLKKLF